MKKCVPNPLYVSLLRFSPLPDCSLQYRRHTPQHCFYFRYSPLLPSQSLYIDTLYRWLQWINVISVHIHTLTAILGGADKLRKSQSPSCQCETPPHLTSCLSLLCPPPVPPPPLPRSFLWLANSTEEKRAKGIKVMFIFVQGQAALTVPPGRVIEI